MRLLRLPGPNVRIITIALGFVLLAPIEEGWHPVEFRVLPRLGDEAGGDPQSEPAGTIQAAGCPPGQTVMAGSCGLLIRSGNRTRATAPGSPERFETWSSAP